MQNQIKCPHCGQLFKIDETSYDSIVKQIRDHEFSEELEKRVKSSVELEITKVEGNYKEKIQEINLLVRDKDNEIITLKSENENIKNQKKNEIALAISNATKKKDDEINQFKIDIAKIENDLNTNKIILKQQYETQLKAKDEEVKFYKDFKAQQSTKAIGESLEKYCSDEFNKIRAVAFPRAYFEKDNKVSKESGSKGDFIFRDYTEDNTEIVSIMFECKNQMDNTQTKHKNEDFFKELDKDRNEKNCEYAILVSMLESDSELYNQGIVKVSHKYKEMYLNKEGERNLRKY